MYRNSSCLISSQQLLSVFQILNILEGMKCYLIVVLICISLIIIMQFYFSYAYYHFVGCSFKKIVFIWVHWVLLVECAI